MQQRDKLHCRLNKVFFNAELIKILNGDVITLHCFIAKAELNPQSNWGI